ncbi:MAG: TIGR02266 family protein [Sandaracinus sp.]
MIDIATPETDSLVPHDERRKTPRTRLAVDVSLYSESHFFAGLTEDIGEGGLFVATHAAIPRGSSIDLVFTLPNDHEVRVRGTVRWTRGLECETSPGIGIQFDELSSSDAAAVRAFLRHRPPLLWDEDPL